nr:MAG TPA: Protein of unknown function (DUF3772) [Bacteriophage sp.]
MSSRAYLVDLIRSIGEKTALTDHLEEKLLSNPSEDLKALIEQITALRRKQMNTLLSEAENPNPLFWCDFKHAVKAFTNDVEVYEATYTDEAFEQMKLSSEILAGITSLFLGMDFQTCARCLYDKLLVEEINKK